MITVERIDTIEQDLKWARDNADRSAQTRLFIHHIPFLLVLLRPIAEELDAMQAEEEEYLAEDGEETAETEALRLKMAEEDAADSESETETVGEKIIGFFKSDDDADATDSQVDGEGEVGETDQVEWEETSDALEAESDLDKADPEVGEAEETPE